MNNPANIFEKLKRFKQNTSAQSDKSNPRTDSPETQTGKPEKPSFPKALLNIPGVVQASKLKGVKKKRESEKEAFLESIGFEMRERAGGSYAYREVVVSANDLQYRPGKIAGSELAAAQRDAALKGVDPHSILFVDTETTGLAGGAGTVPFLIGAGYFRGDDFHVAQFFMRDYPDEEALLPALEDLAGRFDAICTYNGKNFDLPLIQTRFLMNRMRTRMVEMPHIDLLYTARRLWKKALPDCRLSTVETEVLGHDRGDDIPGEMIPYVYFDFVRGMRMERMKTVLHHNAEDISTLAMMAAKVCCLFREPETECGNPSEWLGIARTYYDMDEIGRAAHCLETALSGNSAMALDDGWAVELRRYLSLVYKRHDRIMDAVRVWHEMLEFPGDCFPHIELAKYYEHQEKSFDQALRLTEQALEIHASHLRHNGHATTGGSSTTGGHATTLCERLLHRKARLTQKMK